MLVLLLLLFLPLQVLTKKSNEFDMIASITKFPLTSTSSSIMVSANPTIADKFTHDLNENIKRFRRNIPEGLYFSEEKRKNFIPYADFRYSDDERKPHPYETFRAEYQKPRDRREMLGPLSEEFSGTQIYNSVNLSGRRERPFYVDEPPYVIVRREIDYPEIIDSDNGNDLFIPPRGRRSVNDDNDAEIEFYKRLNSDLIYNNQDLFVPNRGKKAFAHPTSSTSLKRAKFNDIFVPDDLFFPNRGKKDKTNSKHQTITNLFDPDELFYPNRGKKFTISPSPLNVLLNEHSNDDDNLFYPNRGKKFQLNHHKLNKRTGTLNDITMTDLFFPNRGKRNFYKREIKLQENLKNKTKLIDNLDKKRNNLKLKLNNELIQKNKKIKLQSKHKQRSLQQQRYKRDLLDNLSKEKDTFYSARGRRTGKQSQQSLHFPQNIGKNQFKDNHQAKLKLVAVGSDRNNLIKKFPSKYGEPQFQQQKSLQQQEQPNQQLFSENLQQLHHNQENGHENNADNDDDNHFNINDKLIEDFFPIDEFYDFDNRNINPNPINDDVLLIDY